MYNNRNRRIGRYLKHTYNGRWINVCCGKIRHSMIEIYDLLNR